MPVTEGVKDTRCEWVKGPDPVFPKKGCVQCWGDIMRIREGDRRGGEDRRGSWSSGF